MKILYMLALLSLPVLSQNGFRPLWDGKTLDGWEGDSRLWSVRDGAIVGLWLLGIIGNLLIGGGWYDIALRDLGLSLGAFALWRLALEFDRPAEQS